MKMKKGLKIRIIASNPTEVQDEFSIKEYIGQEYEVIYHWQQSKNIICLEKGQIQVIIPEEGMVVLNKDEYEIISK